MVIDFPKGISFNTMQDVHAMIPGRVGPRKKKKIIIATSVIVILFLILTLLPIVPIQILPPQEAKCGAIYWPSYHNALVSLSYRLIDGFGTVFIPTTNSLHFALTGYNGLTCPNPISQRQCAYNSMGHWYTRLQVQEMGRKPRLHRASNSGSIVWLKINSTYTPASLAYICVVTKEWVNLPKWLP